MVKPIATKQEQYAFTQYVATVCKGQRTINSVYKNPSGAKMQAWARISRECVTNHGSYLTVTGANCSFFSTGYLIFANSATQPVTQVYFVRHTPTKRVEYKLTTDQINLLLANGIKSHY